MRTTLLTSPFTARLSCLGVVFLLGVAACSDEGNEVAPGALDADRSDTDDVSGDTGSADTAAGDTGNADTATGDTGTSDTGNADTATGDTGASDTLVADSSDPDSDGDVTDTGGESDGSGEADTGPDVDECADPSGCFRCPAETIEFLNQCTTSLCQGFDNAARLPLFADPLPPLP